MVGISRRAITITIYFHTSPPNIDWGWVFANSVPGDPVRTALHAHARQSRLLPEYAMELSAHIQTLKSALHSWTRQILSLFFSSLLSFALSSTNQPHQP